MDKFYTYVSIGALVLLILILIVVGVTLSNLKKTDLYPPVQATCPDYWDVSSNPQYCGLYVKSDTGIKNKGSLIVPQVNNTSKAHIDPSNNKNVGFCTNSSKFGCSTTGNAYIPTDPAFNPGNSDYQYVQLNNNPNLSGSLFKGTTDRCAKKRWADSLGITWDGVTNYNGC